MSPDRASAVLALFEASRALELARKALLKLGSKEQADEVRLFADDLFDLLADVQREQPRAAEVVS